MDAALAGRVLESLISGPMASAPGRVEPGSHGQGAGLGGLSWSFPFDPLRPDVLERALARANGDAHECEAGGTLSAGRSGEGADGPVTVRFDDCGLRNAGERLDGSVALLETTDASTTSPRNVVEVGYDGFSIDGRRRAAGDHGHGPHLDGDGLLERVAHPDPARARRR